MNTKKKINKKLKIITEPEDGAEYVSVSEYIRKRHQADLLNDPLAEPLYHTSLRRVIENGDMQILVQGGHRFVDWNKYKSFVFMRYKQMPKPKVQVKTKPHK